VLIYSQQMKFPITREKLQAFNPVEEKEKMEELDVQNHIHTIVQDICYSLEHV